MTNKDCKSKMYCDVQDKMIQKEILEKKYI